MKSARYALAIDAGGSFFKSSIVQDDGTIVKNSQKKTAVNSQGDKDEIFNAYLDIINNTFDYAQKNGLLIEGIGISTPGPFDYKNSISYMKHKFQSIFGINLIDELYSRCKCIENLPIQFVHDAHAFLLGEYLIGSANSFNNIAAVVIGTGIGFGIIKNRELLTNAQGGPYVSIFRMPLDDGILEDYVSRRGIINIYNKLAGKDKMSDIDVIDIANLASENNDEFALDAFSTAGRILAHGIHDVLNEQEIECLILGGQISKSFNLMKDELRNGLMDIKSLKKIMMGCNIDFSAQIGAAAVIFDINL